MLHSQFFPARFNQKLYGGLLIILHFLVFWNTITATFAMADDFYFLNPFFMQDHTLGSNVMVCHGRPILGALYYIFFGLFTKVHELIWIRLFSLICSIIFSFSLYGYLKRLEVSAFYAFIVTSICVLMPSWCVFIGWASCFPYPITSFFAFISGIGMVQLSQLTRASKTYYIGMTLSCFLAIFIAANTYQLTVSYFFLPIFILALLRKDLRNPFRSILILSSFFTLSVLIYFVANKLYQSHLRIDSARLTRVTLDWSIQPKIHYIFSYLIPDFLTNWGRMHSPKMYHPAQWTLGNILGFALLYNVFKAIKDKKYYRIPIFLICIMASILPLIITGEKPRNLRTRALMDHLMVLTIFLTYPHLLTLWIPRITQKFRHITAGVILISIAILAKYSIDTQMVGASAHEYKFFTQYIKNRFTARPDCLLYLEQTPVINEYYHQILHGAYEFTASGSIHAFPTSSINVFFNEVFGHLDTEGNMVKTDVIKSRNPIILDPPCNIPVMVPAKLLGIPYQINNERSYKTINNPRFGHLAAMYDDYWLSDWFGPIRFAQSDAYQYHPLIGWFRVKEGNQWGLVLESHQFGIIWISKRYFPEFWTLPNKEWKQVNVDSNGVVQILEKQSKNK